MAACSSIQRSSTSEAYLISLLTIIEALKVNLSTMVEGLEELVVVVETLQAQIAILDAQPQLLPCPTQGPPSTPAACVRALPKAAASAQPQLTNSQPAAA